MENVYLFCIVIGAILILFVLAKKFPLWRKVYIVLVIGAMAGYIVWRIVFTLNFSSAASGVFSILLVAAELLGVMVATFFAVLFMRNDTSRKQPPAWKADFQPSVAVFIFTYDEPYSLVASSALAANSLPYSNKKVYICDDGHRMELKMVADELGVEYITREGNAHAKAGNINHALAQTQSDLVVFLDADFITKPYMLSEGIPYFQDETVAMVQYPQTFYNKDPFQMLSKRFYNEQDFFMRYIEPELAERNAMVHVGTNAIIRRSALEQIGGVPTKSITEDMATGILLQNAGYRTVFVNKAYALGLAPFNIKDLKAQRQRWAKGTLQIYKSIKPFRLKGLRLGQKMLYLQLLLYWYSSFQKLVYIISPTIFMLFAVPIVNMTAADFLLVVIPTQILFGLSFNVLIGNVRSYLSSHIYDTLMAPYHAAALLKETFRTSRVFAVTPKEVKTASKWDLKSVAPHIVLLIWVCAALVVAIIKMTNPAVLLPLLVCAGWSIYNLYALVYAIRAARVSNLETAGEAMSIDIHEMIRVEGQEFLADHMSFDGFLMRKSDTQRETFEQGKLYEFQGVRTGLVTTAVFRGEWNGEWEFKYMNTKRDAAYRLSKFYVEKLHAAKVMNFEVEDERKRAKF